MSPRPHMEQIPIARLFLNKAKLLLHHKSSSLVGIGEWLSPSVLPALKARGI